MSKEWCTIIFIIEHSDQLNKRLGRVDGEALGFKIPTLGRDKTLCEILINPFL